MIILSVIIAEIGFIGFFTFIYLAYKAYAKGDFPSLRDNERFELYLQQIEYKS